MVTTLATWTYRRLVSFCTLDFSKEQLRMNRLVQERRTLTRKGSFSAGEGSSWFKCFLTQANLSRQGTSRKMVRLIRKAMPKK